jgi:hypothetical protein
MPHVYGRNDLHWHGDSVRLRSGRVVATIGPDKVWRDMWRVHLPDGHVTDMVNRTRAKDAAATLALAALNPVDQSVAA